MQVSTSNFRNGLKIELGGEPYIIVEFQHVKPGKGGAFVRTKLKNMETGRVLDKTFRAGEKVPEAEVEQKQMQFLYRDGDHYYFMDTTTYEQTYLQAEQLGEARELMPENVITNILFYKGKAIGVELPFFVELKVADTDPGVRGDTSAGGSKPATLETGAVIQVPLFINIGDTIRIDTRSREYIERVQG
jgi:elongation factor P